jgi:hypothetical protein
MECGGNFSQNLSTNLEDLNQRRTLLKEVSRPAQEEGLDELEPKM